MTREILAIDVTNAAGRLMADVSNPNTSPPGLFSTGRRAELIVFAIIAAFIWPVVTVGVVGGYGFAVWMSQLILGPPGPPPG